MNDKVASNPGEGAASREKLLDKVIPTLFIGVGGTGAEVLWRVRRRILSRVWTGGEESIRLDSLHDFPFAQFLHVDLDMNTVTESGKTSEDPLHASVAFKPNESYVKKLDLSKYIGTDEKLRSYPLVESWFPLSAQRVADLNINPEKGAGQIRSISRLYFFDRYQEIRNGIKRALSSLRESVTNSAKHKRLGLTLMPGSLRVVVIASTAGGTGSGACIDMGYISKILLAQSGAESASSQLILMLPTGYRGANAERTQANTYGALMELETCMRGGASHMNGWSEDDVEFDMPSTPYDDVYFLDTENVAAANTMARNDCFDMAADVLFEDFSTAEFANRKRSISVNQSQHKIRSYSSRVDREKYGDLKLTFSRAYSAFGQSILDTQMEQRQTMVVERQVSRMLGVFFGVSSETGRTSSAQPTEADRDALLDRFRLGFANEVIQYDFASVHDQFKKGAERSIAPLVTELLRVDGRVRLEAIESGIEQRFDEVKQAGDHKQWPVKFADLMRQIRRDTIRGVEAGSGLHEDGIQRQRMKLRADLLVPADDEGVIRALWVRVDNKEKGGLDFAIELIQRMKDRMENAETGLAKRLDEASKWFADLSGYIDNTEISLLKEHLDQAVAKWVGGKSQSEAKWVQLCQAAKAFMRYHLLSVACREAATLVRELSKDLGNKQGTDAEGVPIWAGFIGELERGRRSVRQLMDECQTRISRLQEALKQQHAMYQVLPAPRSAVDELAELPASQAREWAERVFADFGGTQELFQMLDETDGRLELTGKLRNQAMMQISQWNEARGQLTEENPLFRALDALAPGERQHLLEVVMQRAMPWAALRLDRFLSERSPEDQYKCLIGVKDSAVFKRKYGVEMLKTIPPSTKMTQAQVDFLEISEPGRLVCYVELSGVPAPALRDLADWYASYKVENFQLPVHTHKSLGKFVHARELSASELADRKADLELMIQGIALRELTRSAKRTDDGVLILKVQGAQRAVGDEKSIRLNGFDSRHRALLSTLVQDALAALERPDQLALWAKLMSYYKESVYPIHVVRGDDNKDRDEMHLPTLVCDDLERRALARLDACGLSGAQRLLLLQEAERQLKDWTAELPGSESDPYRHEVGQGDDEEGPRPKRILLNEVFAESWSLTPTGNPGASAAAFAPGLGGSGQLVSMPPSVPAGLPPALPGGMAAPLPIQAPVLQFFLNVRGQNYGPFPVAVLQSMVPTGQLTGTTMVWRDGMPAWTPAAAVPELASLFMPLPAATLPGTPPAIGSGASALFPPVVPVPPARN